MSDSYYMAVIPTYRVTFHTATTPMPILRVPKDDLETVVKVLVFNSIPKFTVELETSPLTTQYEGLQIVPSGQEAV